MNLIILIYFLLTVLNSTILLKVLKKDSWSLFSYALVYFIIFFNIVPILILLFKVDSSKYAYKIPDFYQDTIISFYMLLVIIVGFIFFYLGYFVTITRKKISIIKRRKFNNSDISTIGIVCITFLSLIGMILYVKGFGSLSSAIENANLVRSGLYKDIESSKDTSYTFFFRFIFLAIIPFLYFFFSKKKTKLIILLFIISVSILFILYFFLSPGRQSILDIGLIFIFSSLILTRKFFNSKLIIFAIIAVILLPILDAYFSNSTNINNHKKTIDVTIINEFGFPFISLYYSIVEDYNYFFFTDFYAGMFGKLFPSSLGPNIIQTNTLNTLFITGERNKGYVPPGFFTQGYYSLGILGVIIISFFTGFFFKKVDLFFRNIIKIDNKFVYFYVYFIVQSLAWTRTTLPANYFYNFSFIVFWLFLFSSFKFIKNKK